MTYYVLYIGEYPNGVFDSYEDIAKFLNVTRDTVKFYTTPTYDKRNNSKTKRHIEVVEL